MTRSLLLALAATPLVAGPMACPPAKHAKPVPIDAHVVARHVRVLAADEMEGRGVGTKGIDAAADYIAAEMEAAGLVPGGPDGSWFQPFEMTTGVALGANNEATLGGKPAKMDEEWRPIELSESGVAEGELVFAGYGITAPELGWDDYDGLDVKGKIVVVLRHEPGEKDPHSPFGGTELTRYSEVRVKAINARVHGAAAMLLVNDVLAHEPGADELMPLDPQAEAAFAGIPVAHVKRAALEAALGGTTVASLEKAIADAGKPASRSLAPARARLAVDLKKTKTTVKNVIGVRRGSDASLSDEAIVIGAHYDHLGFGGSHGSLDPDKKGEPHNGADDNASGTAALLAIARSLGPAGPAPKRSLVFIAFTAEEAGLGGSSWYVNHPTWPLEKVVAMLNMDMIGRLREKKVIAFGAATGEEFREILDAANTEKLLVTASGDGYGPSDQTAFYAKGIPVLHFFTGAHSDYHRTTDDADKIEAEGLAQVTRLVRGTALAIANRDTRVTFVPSNRIEQARGQTGGGTGGYGAYFGSVPDFTESEEPGVQITGTRAGSPAEKAGLAGGDRIVKFGDVDVKNLHDLTFALRKYKPGDEVTVSFVRGAETRSVRVVLSKR